MIGDKMKKHRTRFFLIALAIASIFMAIGYATVNNTSLTISGVSTMADNGTVRITSVTKVSAESTSSVTSSATHTDDSISITASITINNQSQSSDQHYVTYQVTVENDSIYTYIFGNDIKQPQLSTTAPRNGILYPSYELIGVDAGDPLPAKTTKTFKIKISLSTNGTQGTYQLGVNTTVTAEESDEGIISGSITGTTTGDLTGNTTMAHFTATVLNSYERSKEFTFEIDNQNFSITDSSGNALGNYVIAGNEAGQTYDFYIKRNDGVAFPTDTHRLNVYLNPTDEDRSSIGVVTLTVDADQTIMDFTPPTVSITSITKGNTARTLSVEWNASDNIGVDYYNVYLYNSSNQEIAKVEEIYDKNYTFNNVADGTYHITVEAYDASNNHASASSQDKAYTWTYTVTVNCNNCSATNMNPSNRQVEAGGSFQATLSPNSGYDAPTSGNVSVTMKDSSTDNGNISNPSYNYNNNQTSNYQIIVTNIAGDTTINATSNQSWTCLIKGTKFLMADGSYKKIEDIRYNDLIMVYNHENGEFNPEYPIWIETGNYVSEYQQHTFSDGTILKTVGNHSVFSVDANEFVDVLDQEKFHVGTKVLKVIEDNGNYRFKEVSVVKTETIYEDTHYYNVVSTRYYNAITENILTSDGRPALSNVYNFEGEARWTEARKQEVKQYNIQLPYEQAKYMNYYLYKGLRVNDAAMLFYYHLMPEDFFEDMFVYIINQDSYTLKPPTNTRGIRLWMATTSEDDLTNKDQYLYEEGSYYTVPEQNGITRWYCTGDGNFYNAGDKVQIWHGMHFIKAN
jgi:hypothetical protein